MTDPNDLYARLELTKEADITAIKKAYRKLASQWHPDVCQEENAEEMFQAINEAWQVLSDPKKKATYDATGSWDNNVPNNSPITMAIARMSQFFNSLIDQLEDQIIYLDVKTEILVNWIPALEKKIDEAMKTATRHDDLFKMLKGRVDKSKATNNILLGVVNQRIHFMEQNLDALNKELEVLEAMKELAADQEFIFDKKPPEASRPMRPGHFGNHVQFTTTGTGG